MKISILLSTAEGQYGHGKEYLKLNRVIVWNYAGFLLLSSPSEQFVMEIPIIITSRIHFYSKGWENALFELGGARVNKWPNTELQGGVTLVDLQRRFSQRMFFARICRHVTLVARF